MPCDTTNCNSPSHENHMCALRERGEHELIKKLSDRPTTACRYCGALANSVENICAAHLKDSAPNIEGGHGYVGFNEIGKLHHAGDEKK